MRKLNPHMNTAEMTKRFHELFSAVITVEDVMRQAVNMHDEIERLRTLLDNVLESETKHNLRQQEIVRKAKADRDRWAKWGEHVFTCPNKGINPCRDCVSPSTTDAISRVDKGGAW